MTAIHRSAGPLSLRMQPMRTSPPGDTPLRCIAARRMPRAGMPMLLATAALALGGCALKSGVGIGVPIVPGLALSLGVGPGGPVIGLATGWGPLGAGIGINHRGQVTGSAGVGVGVGVASGAAVGGVGVGVGKSVVLHDPQATAPEGVAPDGVAISGMAIGGAPLGSPGNPVAP